VRAIRMLRAMRRALETGLRKLLTGHEGGNAGNRQGVPFGLPRQCSTLPPRSNRRSFLFPLTKGRPNFKAFSAVNVAEMRYLPRCRSGQQWQQPVSSGEPSRRAPLLFQEIEPGSQDIDFALNPESSHYTLDPSMVFFSNHQRFAHISLMVSTLPVRKSP
jgi:hypothetical protein